MIPAADGSLRQILQSFYGKLLAGSEERGYTHRQKRKEVSAMGFALNAAEDLEDLIYSGTITDGKTIAAIMAYARKYRSTDKRDEALS